MIWSVVASATLWIVVFAAGVVAFTLVDLVRFRAQGVQALADGYLTLGWQNYFAGRVPVALAAAFAVVPPANVRMSLAAAFGAFFIFPLHVVATHDGSLEQFVAYFSGPLSLPKHMWVTNMLSNFLPPLVVIVLGRIGALLRDSGLRSRP